MALIYCPHCRGTISDRAPKCPHCGYQMVTAIPAVNTNSSDFYGTVSDFGIGNCFRMESANFWMRKWRTSVYTTSAYSTHNTLKIAKTREQVLVLWLVGLFGIFGLQYFAVGRLRKGITHLLYGMLMLIVGILVSSSSEVYSQINPLRVMLVFFVFALIPSLINLFFIAIGRFRDVFKNIVV